MTLVADPPAAKSAPYPFARVRVVGVRFDVCDYAGVVNWLADGLQHGERRARYVCVSNVADVMTARSDAEYVAALADSDLTVPDGAPIVWAMRDYGHTIRRRVYGPTLMQEALENPTIATGRHLLVGGSQLARQGVRERFADVNWIGELDFRFDNLTPDAYVRLAADYTTLRPDYAWISLGGGKQVKFMHRFAPLVAGGTLLGVGAAFDFHAGLLSQAPHWMQENGLEWLYRLAVEPGRLWHRYLVLNPPYLWHWLGERRRQRAMQRVPD